MSALPPPARPGQFRGAILRRGCRQAGQGAAAGRRVGEDAAPLGAALWEACRVEARCRLDNLAHRGACGCDTDSGDGAGLSLNFSF